MFSVCCFFSVSSRSQNVCLSPSICICSIGGSADADATKLMPFERLPSMAIEQKKERERVGGSSVGITHCRVSCPQHGQSINNNVISMTKCAQNETNDDT